MSNAWFIIFSLLKECFYFWFLFLILLISRWVLCFWNVLTQFFEIGCECDLPLRNELDFLKRWIASHVFFLNWFSAMCDLFFSFHNRNIVNKFRCILLRCDKIKRHQKSLRWHTCKFRQKIHCLHSKFRILHAANVFRINELRCDCKCVLWRTNRSNQKTFPSLSVNRNVCT